ncbi:flagellar basal body rod protein [Planococcus antarcticus DSM 14505]|uniref:Flagellar basal body rod protein n=1 Tax=Planococcus antarcticus DSM 14505 TaxID=1185653 RepID=A0A1C7DCE8_9BACL|nr:flagellar hook-basal body protein [Planococcus antarcticus]ANU09180.1 flagellar biosynthesis protein FlgG [Planococcus antarcticus DSM 14505]EIM08478.1 flagellar basal body rod protein [Planococcus antarcticus DSM 14505]
MFRGLYTATSGMMANNRQQQILTNNLSNANTPGFKEDQTVLRAFPDQLIKAMDTSKKGTIVPRNIGTLTTGVYTQEGIPSFLQGPLKETGNLTDMVLMDELLPTNPETQQKGSMVFAVAAENEEVRYTKNGSFAVDAEGFLTSSDGFLVLGENQEPIQVGSTDFTVQDNGQIILADGTQGDRLWIGHTENPDQFVKEGQNLLRWAGDPETPPQFIENVDLLNATDSFVKQGFIEQSNVDLTRTMTDMMTTYRGFESNQKVIQAYDRSMEKAVNEIGRV